MSEANSFIQYVRKHYPHCPKALQNFEERLGKQERGEDPVDLWDQVKSQHVEEILAVRPSALA